MKEEKEPENPSAFPVIATEQTFWNQSPLMPETGMTLRDCFAAKPLNNLLPENATGYFGGYSISNKDIIAITEMSYNIADAMLTQRKL